MDMNELDYYDTFTFANYSMRMFGSYLSSTSNDGVACAVYWLIDEALFGTCPSLSLPTAHCQWRCPNGSKSIAINFVIVMPHHRPTRSVVMAWNDATNSVLVTNNAACYEWVIESVTCRDPFGQSLPLNAVKCGLNCAICILSQIDATNWLLAFFQLAAIELMPFDIWMSIPRWDFAC